jgi:two-component system, sporulation sensor kinase E
MQENGCLTLKTYLQDNQVVLAIEDESCGIPAENMNKLGIPFYTTKDYGTGLGLATSYKIVESHNA